MEIRNIHSGKKVSYYEEFKDKRNNLETTNKSSSLNGTNKISFPTLNNTGKQSTEK